MDKLCDEIILTRDAQGDKLEQKIGDLVTTLLAEDETCKIYLDSEGIYVLQHGHDENVEEWGASVLMWLTENEAYDVNELRRRAEKDYKYDEEDEDYEKAEDADEGHDEDDSKGFIKGGQLVINTYMDYLNFFHTVKEAVYDLETCEIDAEGFIERVRDAVDDIDKEA